MIPEELLDGQLTIVKDIATSLHKGQVDKSKESYINHPARVVESLQRAGYRHTVLAAAWLHDVVEDTGISLTELTTELNNVVCFFPVQKIISLVDALTIRKGETRYQYYDRILEHPDAVAIKLEDIRDNLDPERLDRLPLEVAERLRKKYYDALEYLDA